MIKTIIDFRNQVHDYLIEKGWTNDGSIFTTIPDIDGNEKFYLKRMKDLNGNRGIFCLFLDPTKSGKMEAFVVHQHVKLMLPGAPPEFFMPMHCSPPGGLAGDPAFKDLLKVKKFDKGLLLQNYYKRAILWIDECDLVIDTRLTHIFIPESRKDDIRLKREWLDNKAKEETIASSEALR